MKAQFQSHGGSATPIKKQEPDFAWLINDPLYQAFDRTFAKIAESKKLNQ